MEFSIYFCFGTCQGNSQVPLRNVQKLTFSSERDLLNALILNNSKANILRYTADPL